MCPAHIRRLPPIAIAAISRISIPLAAPNHTAAGFPTSCTLCHNTTQWQGAVFDHSKTAFPLTGAHTSVQCAQCHVGGNFTTVPTDCASCHLDRFQQDHQSESRGRGASHQLRFLPHHHQLARRTIRPQQDGLSAHRRACHRAVHPVPRQRQVRGHAHRLRVLPPHRFQQNQQSAARQGRLPHRLHVVSHHHRLAAGDVRSQPGAVPADRRAQNRAVRAVPRGRKLHHYAHRLRVLPPDRFQRDHQSAARQGRLPHRLRLVPYDHDLGRRHVRSQQDARSRSPARTPRCSARNATPTAISLRYRRTADRATWPISTGPPIRRTPRPASPPRAHSATPLRPGPARRSITARRRSR